MKSSIIAVFSGLLFLPLTHAGSYSLSGHQAQAWENICQPVNVYWSMHRCPVFQNRCPHLSVHMTPEIYEELGSPKHGVYHYVEKSLSEGDIKKSVTAQFVYDKYKDQYYFEKTGPGFSGGVAFKLTKLCLRKEDSGEHDNCQPTDLEVTSYKSDPLHEELYFPPPHIKYPQLLSGE